MAGTGDAVACPYCGGANETVARRCGHCGEYLTGEARQNAHARADDFADSAGLAAQFVVPINVSVWAIISCWAGLIGFCIPLAGLIFTIPAVVCGIIALRQIRRRDPSYGKMTGQVRAVIGLVFGGLGTIVHLGLATVVLLGALEK
jgi:predicted branched-subunit amino acid permease